MLWRTFGVGAQVMPLQPSKAFDRERCVLRLSLAVGLLLFLALPASAQTFTTAREGFSVSDGDTVRYGKQLIRMFGIDAPEKGPACDDGKWLPDPLVTKALVDFIGGRAVICYQVDFD